MLHCKQIPDVKEFWIVCIFMFSFKLMITDHLSVTLECNDLQVILLYKTCIKFICLHFETNLYKLQCFSVFIIYFLIVHLIVFFRLEKGLYKRVRVLYNQNCICITIFDIIENHS